MDLKLLGSRVEAGDQQACKQAANVLNELAQVIAQLHEIESIRSNVIGQLEAYALPSKSSGTSFFINTPNEWF